MREQSPMGRVERVGELRTLPLRTGSVVILDDGPVPEVAAAAQILDEHDSVVLRAIAS